MFAEPRREEQFLASELGRRLAERRNGAGADVLAVEEARAIGERPRPKTRSSSGSRGSHWRGISPGSPTTSQSRRQNFGSSAEMVRRLPSAVA